MTEVLLLERDLLALIKLTNSKQPRERLTRDRDREESWYLLGDASQSGFGTGLFAKWHFMF